MQAANASKMIVSVTIHFMFSFHSAGYTTVLEFTTIISGTEKCQTPKPMEATLPIMTSVLTD